jgi:hypothetical protein
LIEVSSLEAFVDSLREENAPAGRLTVVAGRDLAPKEKARRRVDAEPKEAARVQPTDQFSD